jgi:hypothetical protein
VRSGCLSLVVRVGMVSAATMLAALSAALILSFGVSALGQPEGIERILKAVVAAAAGFAFFLVGRAIWRDLRRRSSEAEKSFEERER